MDSDNNNNNDNTTNFHNHNIKLILPDEDDDGNGYGDGDGDESLSLCDFPINSDRKDSISKNNRRSSSEPADFFEFLNDFTSVSEISHAEDIFYCGKLVPYAATHRRRFLKSLSEHNQYHSIHSSSTATMTTYTYDGKSNAACCRRSSAPLRSRNLEHHRIPRQSDIRRSSSKSSAKSEASSRDSRPKWFVLMFGRPLKFQQELDFRGVRNRQIRRNPGSIFPGGGMDAGDVVPANRRNWRSFWSHDLLRALSCKDDASVAVTASVLVPHF